MEHLDEFEMAMFIKGELSEEDFERVLKHLEVCKECQKKYQALLFIKSFSDKMDENKKFGRWKLIYLVAASIILILTFSLFITSLILKNKYEKSYLAYVERSVYPYNKTVTREGGRNEFERVMSFYERGEYGKFISEMEKYIKKNKELFSSGSFYIGVSYYHLKDYGHAEKFLKFSTTDFTPKFYPERFWYLANTFIMEGKFSEAKKILRELSSFNNPYRENSLRLLKSIE